MIAYLPSKRKVGQTKAKAGIKIFKKENIFQPEKQSRNKNIYSLLKAKIQERTLLGNKNIHTHLRNKGIQVLRIQKFIKIFQE